MSPRRWTLFTPWLTLVEWWLGQLVMLTIAILLVVSGLALAAHGALTLGGGALALASLAIPVGVVLFTEGQWRMDIRERQGADGVMDDWLTKGQRAKVPED